MSDDGDSTEMGDCGQKKCPYRSSLCQEYSDHDPVEYYTSCDNYIAIEETPEFLPRGLELGC